MGILIGMVAMNYLKPIHDARVKELRTEKPSKTFDTEMRELTITRDIVARHNRQILTQYWNDKCDGGQNKIIPICADGPPMIMP
jgi:hypothetical protein